MALSLTEERLLRIPAGVKYSAVITSPDGRHAAYWETRGPREHMPVIDGVARRTSHIGFTPVYFTFSADSRQVIYPAQRGSDFKWIVVTDGGEAGPYERVLNFPLVAPRSYSALLATEGKKEEKKEVAIIEGRPGTAYKRIMPGFSCRGTEHTVYLAKKSRKWVAVVDGEEARVFNEPYPFYPSPDLTRVAYPLELDEGGVVMVADGRQSRPYDRVGPMSYAPDSRRTAYDAERNGQGYVILDGEEVGPYARAYSTWFSPDSRYVASIVVPISAGELKRQAILVDGRQGPEFGAIHGVTYSPDSRRLLYIATDPETKREHLVIDGEPGPQCVMVASFGGSPQFSPDSRHVAAMVRTGQRWQLVLDGLPVGNTYDRFLGPLAFDSSTSLHVTVQNLDERGSDVYRVGAKLGDG